MFLISTSSIAARVSASLSSAYKQHSFIYNHNLSLNLPKLRLQYSFIYNHNLSLHLPKLRLQHSFIHNPIMWPTSSFEH